MSQWSSRANFLRLQVGDEIADVIASALFVRRVRCSGSEFLEARISAQLIEFFREDSYLWADIFARRVSSS
jgi:hypothetical protein